MFKLFIPASKVHRDRRLMRETDARMAKYSRRGVLINFCVFVFCLVLADMYTTAPRLTVVISIGFVLLTLMRSYYLFRFDSLYPRAPSKWRNKYFLTSMVGAAWWSFILASFTLVNGLTDATTILWFYTIVFFSSTANALAPYHKYMSWYQCLGLIPGALAAILLGTLTGYLYGVMILLFFLMMNHQGKIVAESYWKSLETNQALTLKTIALEAEKRDMAAADQFSADFMQNIGSEVRINLNDLLGNLSLLEKDNMSTSQRDLVDAAHRTGLHQLEMINNVGEYLNMVGQQYEIEPSVFNLRRLLENVLEDLSEDALHQNTELNYLLNATIPLRVKGDANRVQQILHQLIYHVMYSGQADEIMVSGQFILANERNAQLQLKIKLVGSPSEDKYSAWEKQSDAVENNFALMSNWELSTTFIVCKALAESIDGYIEVSPSRHQVIANIPLEVSGASTQEVLRNPRLQGVKVLLVGVSKEMRQAMVSEYQDWGMLVDTEHNLAKAQGLLQDAVQAEKPYRLLIIDTHLSNTEWLHNSMQIAQDPTVQSTCQLILGYRRHLNDDRVKVHIDQHEHIILASKPISPHAVHSALEYLLLRGNYQKPNCINHEPGVVKCFDGNRILLVDDHKANQIVTQKLLTKLNLQVTTAIHGQDALDKLKGCTYDLILMDCNMPVMDGFEATQKIREDEIASEQLDADGIAVSDHIPIIGMSSHLYNGEKARSFAAGMDDYLPKPLDFESLQRMLQRWIHS